MRVEDPGPVGRTDPCPLADGRIPPRRGAGTLLDAMDAKVQGLTEVRRLLVCDVFGLSGPPLGILGAAARHGLTPAVADREMGGAISDLDRMLGGALSEWAGAAGRDAPVSADALMSEEWTAGVPLAALAVFLGHAAGLALAGDRFLGRPAARPAQ